MPIDNVDAYIVWEEPNRAETPTLHIGRSGERYSTITGVWWLDETSFLANHRSGLRMAIFHVNNPSQPVWKAELDYPTDDIAAKRIDETTWEASVSGCWSSIYGRYRINRSRSVPWNYQSTHLDTRPHETKDFAHGVAYDDEGQLCYTLSTGKNPRFNIGETTYKLPTPWGVRDVIYDPDRQRYIAIAVSANPKLTAYGGVKSSLWVKAKAGHRWKCIGVYKNVHSDSLGVWRDRIWLPDQVGNRLLAVDARTGKVEFICKGNSFDFPHGLGVSPTGKIAVTNYGTSSVTIVDGDKLLAHSGLGARNSKNTFTTGVSIPVKARA